MYGEQRKGEGEKGMERGGEQEHKHMNSERVDNRPCVLLHRETE